VADSANSRVLRWPGSAHLAGGQPADLVIGQPDFETADYHSPTLGGSGLTAYGLDYPLAAAIDSDGTLFVSDWFDNRVLVYDPPLTSGMAATAVLGQDAFDQGDAPGAPAADNLNEPLGLAVDSSGRLFVADGEHNRVLLFEPPFTPGKAASLVIGQPNFTSAVTATVSAASLNYPFGLAFDAGGNLYVADSHNHRVLIYTPPFNTGMAASRVLGQGDDFTTNQANKGGLSAASLYWPTGVAVDSARNLLYVSDGDNHRVLLYQDPLNGDAAADNVFGQAGSFTTGEANKGGLSAASLSLPMGVAVDAAGNLLIADSDNNRVLTYLIPNASANVYLPIIQK
jgi:DNA-binding beta-propeller fold protein YncE